MFAMAQIQELSKVRMVLNGAEYSLDFDRFKQIVWEFFQSKHGDNTCDAGASHGQQHIDNEPKKGRAPPKCAVEVIPLLGQIDKHSAELIEGRSHCLTSR